jgi:hypothetical protein
MSAELLSHRRQQLLGKGVTLPGAKARKQRRRQDIGRHRLFNSRRDRPSSLTGILDDPCIVRQRGIFRERHRRQVEQP